MFNWDRAFKNSNVNDMVDISTKTIYNMFSNFIPRQIITIDDKDQTSKPEIDQNILLYFDL